MANLANWNQTNKANEEVEDKCQAYRQHQGFQRKLSKTDIPLRNAYNADLQTTIRASALDNHKEVTHHNGRTRHQL